MVCEVDQGAGTVQQDPAEPTRVRTGFHLLVDGHLNPLLFSPKWFHREGLLRKEEVETAEATQTTDPSFLAFNTNDFSLVVSLDSLEIFANSDSLEPVIRDLLLNAFTLVRHTPLSMLTISRSAHLASSVEPNASPAWSKLLPLAPFEQVLGKATIVDISAQGSAGPVPENAQVTISVQPSKVQGAVLFIECRYAYGLTADDRNSSVDVLVDLLKSAMETTKYHSNNTFKQFSNLLLTASGRARDL